MNFMIQTKGEIPGFCCGDHNRIIDFLETQSSKEDSQNLILWLSDHVVDFMQRKAPVNEVLHETATYKLRLLEY